MAAILSIAYKPAGIEPRPEDRFARMPVESAELIEGRGIAGDLKSRLRQRHLNVMNGDTLAALARDGCRTAPGEMGEQIVLSGVPLEDLPAGTRLRLGSSAIIELRELRTGCSRLAHIQQIAIRATRGRLGWICRVLAGGPIRVGDAVQVLPLADQSAASPA